MTHITDILILAEPAQMPRDGADDSSGDASSGLGYCLFAVVVVSTVTAVLILKRAAWRSEVVPAPRARSRRAVHCRRHRSGRLCRNLSRHRPRFLLLSLTLLAPEQSTGARVRNRTEHPESTVRQLP